MGSRDRDTKSLQDKLKVFFNKKGGAAGAGPAARGELALSAELARELCADSAAPRRARALRDLAERALQARFQDGVCERVWQLTRDLLEPGAGGEARAAALGYWRCACEGQAERLLPMRTVLFRYLRAAGPAVSDLQPHLRLLHALTDSGKNIACFEEEMGPFLLEWLSAAAAAEGVELLQLAINVVKFNANALDEPVVHGLITHACHVCAHSCEAGAVSAALALLEAVASYSLLPSAALGALVRALCLAVTLEPHCAPCWKLMRQVLAADAGAAALLQLLRVLRDTDAAPGLLRGAVFFVNMALWGAQRVPTLRASLLVVLPALRVALDGEPAALAAVAYEVALGLQSLLARAPTDPPELHEPAWDVLLDIMRRLLALERALAAAGGANELLHTRLHALLTSVEQLHAAGQYMGDADALLDLIDSAGHERPEASAAALVSARCAALSPWGRDWAGAALALAERYLRQEARLAVRLHTLQALLGFIMRHRTLYGEELVERVGVPVAGACALDAEPALRAAGARACAELARACSSAACVDLVDLLDKVLNRPFEVYVCEVSLGGEAGARAEAEAVRAAGAALASLLHAKLPRAPPAHAARALAVLLDHLEHHYKRPALLQQHPDVRIKILELVFGLRTNQYNWVGHCYDERGAPLWGAAALRTRPLCSPLLLAEPLAARGAAPAAARELPPGACAVPAARVARALNAALARESEWSVLGGVLRALPSLLHARALCVGRRAQDLDLLASTVCSMLCDRSLCYPECLRGAQGSKVPVSEFHGAALPALAAFAPYHAYLEPTTQHRIVRCLLKYGMVLRKPQPFITALTTLTLEMRDTMVRMLPEVLLDLSKVSDTQLIAGPMLEFLSTLTRLPRVFASFVEDQYMSVFAIVLPYTNPSRYNHYVVSLAHHVIAAWFLKCRLPYRRNFVRFIIHGLHNYIIMPFEEQLQHRFQPPPANEDSSNRQRSSSLGSRRRPAAHGAGPSGRGSSASAAFHVELTETCVDLLSRYAHTPCSVKPQRSDTAQFLFGGGAAQTWLVGHKLVTVTTAGCAMNSLKQGLCDRCAVLCRQHADSVASPLPPLAPIEPAAPAPPVQVQVSDGDDAPEPLAEPPAEPPPAAAPAHPPEVKRYSKHSLQHSRSTDTSGSSLSISELQPPAPATPAPSSGRSSRQNSSEARSGDALADALAALAQRSERLGREVEGAETGWSRVGELAAGGACPCWCAQWAEVHVRAPSGDVAWVMRVQNQMNWDYLSEWPLQDVAALLTPPAPPAGAPSPAPADSRHDLPADCSARSRSGSASSQSRAAHAHRDLHKSSSDSVVASAPRAAGAALAAHAPQRHPQQHRMSTQPINIPGSPQRQSSSSTTDDADDDLLSHVPASKSRHPVRRSNSSPEMSSSWKLPAPPSAPASPRASPPASPAPPAADEEAPRAQDPNGMIVLPVCEPTSNMSVLRDAKKAAKKSDMRVSCEAIPEEMSGTSPHAPAAPPAPPAHAPHLMTYNSDPGTSGEEGAGTAPADKPHHQLQKTASDSTVPHSKPPASPRAAPAAARELDELPPLARSKRSNTISVMSPTRRASRSVPGPHSKPPASPRAAPAAARELDELPPLARSKRSNTISVMSPTRRASREAARAAPAPASGAGGGVTAAFVFLQLYHNMSTYPISPPVPGEAPAMLDPLAERPLRVSGTQHERTVKNIDLVPPIETFKVGVLYVAPGQHDNEVAILRNEHGSLRYADFLSGLGRLVPLEGARAPPDLFLNLEYGGKDGAYTYVWSDDVMQVLFHVGTAMPTRAADPTCNEKRKYIGNDHVSIVYNDSGADFNILTIKGQFNSCVVVVEPLEHGTSRVTLKTKDERVASKFLPHLEPQVVCDANAALLARQVALHASLASQISASLTLGGAPYASNSLERLRLIKRLRRRAEAERLAAAARAPEPYAGSGAPDIAQRVAIDDFNDYT